MTSEDSYEVEVAKRNASRMAHMSDAEIRKAIATLKGLLPMYADTYKHPTAKGYRDDLAVYGTELLRRACAAFDVPFLTSLPMVALTEAAKNGSVSSASPKLIELFRYLCGLGLMREASGEFTLTVKALDLLEAAEEESVNLLDAHRAKIEADSRAIASMAADIARIHADTTLNTATNTFCGNLVSRYAESIRTEDAPALSEHQMGVAAE